MLLAQPALLSTSYRNAVIDTPGLVGYWRFGETAGTVARDQCGINDGAYAGTPTLGVSGVLAGDPDTAVTLNGTTQYMSLTDTATFDIFEGTSPFSIALWINLTGVSATQVLFGNRQSASPFNAVGIQSQSGFSYFFRYDGTGSDETYFATLTTGRHFIVVTGDAVAMRGYQDGIVWPLAFGGLGAVTRTMPALNGHRFGMDPNGNNALAGTIDEGMIFNRSLTAAEVARFYRLARGF